MVCSYASFSLREWITSQAIVFAWGDSLKMELVVNGCRNPLDLVIKVGRENECTAFETVSTHWQTTKDGGNMENLRFFKDVYIYLDFVPNIQFKV